MTYKVVKPLFNLKPPRRFSKQKRGVPLKRFELKIQR